MQIQTQVQNSVRRVPQPVRAERLARELGRPLAMREFLEAGINSNAVTGLCGRKLLLRVSRGLYAVPGVVAEPKEGKSPRRVAVRLTPVKDKSTDIAVEIARRAGKPVSMAAFAEAGISGGIVRYLVARGRLVKCGWHEFAVPECAEDRPLSMVARAVTYAADAAVPIQAREFRSAGIPSWALARAVVSEQLVHLGRGVYASPTAAAEAVSGRAGLRLVHSMPRALPQSVPAWMSSGAERAVSAQAG